MKKMGILLLTVCLFCAACVPAGAENGYLLLKVYFSLEDYGDLGTPYVVPNEDVDEKTVYVIYDQQTGLLMIRGENDEGAGEISAWSGLELADGLIALLRVCREWDVIENTLDSGYSLALCFNADEENQLWIHNAEEAAQFVEAVRELAGVE